MLATFTCRLHIAIYRQASGCQYLNMVNPSDDEGIMMAIALQTLHACVSVDSRFAPEHAT